MTSRDALFFALGSFSIAAFFAVVAARRYVKALRLYRRERESLAAQYRGERRN